MKAVAYRTPGPIDRPDALIDLDLPAPQPGPRDLLVRVRAISVNPVDAKVRASAQPAADLPGGARSGLRAASDILDGIDDIHFSELTSADVVRHRLVSQIVDAYSRHEAQPELINRAQRRSSGGRPRR